MSEKIWSGKLWGARHEDERKEHEHVDPKELRSFSEADVLDAVKIIQEELSGGYVDAVAKMSEKRLRRMSSACVLWYQEGKAPEVWTRDALDNLSITPTMVQYLDGCSPVNAINLAVLMKVSPRVFDLYTAHMGGRRMYDVDKAIGHEVRNLIKLAEDYDVTADEVQRVTDLIEDPMGNIWWQQCEEYDGEDEYCSFGDRCKKLHMHKRVQRG